MGTQKGICQSEDADAALTLQMPTESRMLK